jgi:hypothetical protein
MGTVHGYLIKVSQSPDAGGVLVHGDVWRLDYKYKPGGFLNATNALELMPVLSLPIQDPSRSLPRPTQLLSVLNALDKLEKEWDAYQAFLDRNDEPTPQVSALLERINRKCQSVYNLLTTIVLHGQKRPREGGRESVASRERPQSSGGSNTVSLGDNNQGTDQEEPDTQGGGRGDPDDEGQPKRRRVGSDEEDTDEEGDGEADNAPRITSQQADEANEDGEEEREDAGGEGGGLGEGGESREEVVGVTKVNYLLTLAEAGLKTSTVCALWIG